MGELKAIKNSDYLQIILLYSSAFGTIEKLKKNWRIKKKCNSCDNRACPEDSLKSSSESID